MKLKNINLTAMRLLPFLKDIDIVKELVSNKISFGEKIYQYIIGYLYNDNKVKPLHTMLPKTSPQVKRLWWTKKMDVFLDSRSWLNKVVSKLVCNEGFLKVKVNFHGDEVTGFYDKKILNFNFNSTCLPVISLKYAVKEYNNSFSQVFLK